MSTSVTASAGSHAAPTQTKEHGLSHAHASKGSGVSRRSTCRGKSRRSPPEPFATSATQSSGSGGLAPHARRKC
eukprot:3759862-Pleurochrysis_carterae.AAC.1